MTYNYYYIYVYVTGNSGNQEIPELPRKMVGNSGIT